MPQPRKYDSHAHRQAAYHQRRQEAQERQLRAKGLPALPAVPTIPGIARWSRAIDCAVRFLATVEREMQEYYDGRSDAWKESERGEDFRARLETVAEVKGSVEDLLTM